MKEQNAVYTVYEEGSFSKAAARLYVSQPALSLAVKKVENELGITIFDRSTSPLRLTEEGEIYIRAVEDIRSIERNMAEKLSDVASLRAGALTVSGENFVSSFILPEILRTYASKYPAVDVKLVESNSPDLRKQLLSETIDLLVAHDFDPNVYCAEELFEERIYLAVPKTLKVNEKLKDYAMTRHTLSLMAREKEAVDLAWFSDEEFLLLKPGNDCCHRAFAMCRRSGFAPREQIRLDQLITAYNLAQAGMGITFVSDVLVEKAKGDECFFYKLDAPEAKRSMSIGYKKNRYLSKAAAAFIETAKEVYRR